MRLSKKLGTAAVLLAFAFTACAHWSEHETGRNSSAGSSFYQEVIAVYEGPLNRLEAVRRGECPMYPSCSQYSKEAVARFGFVKGWVMSMDRLMRCGRDEVRLAPKIWVNGEWKIFDPVETNDFP